MEINIVTLDNPLPPDYGGAIDLYYKILTLHKLNVDVNLYYFAKPTRLTHTNQLSDFCKSITPILRKDGWTQAFNQQLPYPIAVRTFPTGIYRKLLEFPTLFDGLHTTGVLTKLIRLNPVYKWFLRSHNIESQYYKELSQAEFLGIKKFFFSNQSYLFKNYEKKILTKAQHIFSISLHETTTLRNFNSFVSFLPAFIGSENIKPLSPPNNIKTLLYTANFSIKSNQQTCLNLINFVKKSSAYHLIVAGKCIPKNLIHNSKFLTFINNPKEISAIYNAADVVLAPQTQTSGVKLKVLMALKAGKVVLGTQEAFLGTGLPHQSFVYCTDQTLSNKLRALENEQLNEDIQVLSAKFTTLYDDLINGQKLLKQMLNP